MLLLTGAPGSGKTRWCLNHLRARLAEHDNRCRLLVPTSTMAEHLRNELTREGFVFSPRVVSTFGKFIADYVQDLRSATTAGLHIYVREELAKAGDTRYSAVQDFAGFRSALVSAIEEFSGAGGSPAAAEAADSDFARIWNAVTQRVAAAGCHFRASRLLAAADRIRGGEDLGFIWITGFFGFTDPELAVIEALSERSQLTVALADSPGAGRALEVLRSFAHEELPVKDDSPASPERVLFTAPAIDDEATEIARRILLERERGTYFREMGVIVRSEKPGVAALLTAFSRFGIPCRSYFAPHLRSQPAVRYMLALVDAALHGWEHELTLSALRMHGSPLEFSGDRFEFAVLENLPGAGLTALRALAPAVSWPYFEQLSALDSWSALETTPDGWARRFTSLPAMLSPREIADSATDEQILLRRTENAAVAHFLAAVEETAATLESGRRLSCREFVEALESAMSAITVRIVDRRRDVVHIIDAVEARQWRLPVVFVCGLLDGQFPKHHSEDPILSDTVRFRLHGYGVRLRTTAERQLEEHSLFDAALTRATRLLVLSYAQLNAKGEPNLPSFLLGRTQPDITDRHVPVAAKPLRERAPEPFPSVVDEELRAALAEAHTVVSATRVERYLSCPFSFFAGRMLRLKERPAKIWDRLDSMRQGTIGHRVFELVFGSSIPVQQAFDSVFAQVCEHVRIPAGYRTEAKRLELLYGIERLIRDARLRRRPELALFEQKFEFELAPGIRAAGQIDRLDVDKEGRAVIFDYKYRRQYRIEDTARRNASGERVQSGLYLLGARSLGYTPAGMVFAGFKRESSVAGWVLAGVRPDLGASCSAEHLEDLIAKATEVTLSAHFEILNGHIRPRPAEEQTCEFCSFSTMCRIESLPEEIAAGSIAVAE